MASKSTNFDRRTLRKQLLKCSQKELQKRLRKQKIQFNQNSTKNDMIVLLLNNSSKKGIEKSNKKKVKKPKKESKKFLFIHGSFKFKHFWTDLLVSGFSRFIGIESIFKIIELYLDFPNCNLTYTAEKTTRYWHQMYGFVILNTNLLASNISLKLIQPSTTQSLQYDSKWDNNFECGVIGINASKIKRFCKKMKDISQRNKAALAKPIREVLQDSTVVGLYTEAYVLQWHLDTSSFDYWNVYCHGFNKQNKKWTVHLEGSYSLNTHEKYLFDHGNSIEICINTKNKTLCFVKNKKHLLNQSEDRANGAHQQFVNGFIQLMNISDKMCYFPFFVAAKSFKLEIQFNCPIRI